LLRDATSGVAKDIIVTVCDVRANGNVKLGFTAPEGIAIFRQEVFERMELERMHEAGIDPATAESLVKFPNQVNRRTNGPS
jgi:carbon storage regulator CsrA